MKKTILAAAILASVAVPAFASQYFVVIPVPNRSSTDVQHINVALAGYSLPDALVGQAYAGFDFKSLLSVTGDANYTGYGVHWSVVSGSLPAGLTLNSDGTLSGTPTAAATSSFQVMASYKTKAGQQAYQVVVSSITVALAADTPPQALVGQAYSYDLKSRLSVTGDSSYADNGAGVTWSVVSNTLPAGLQFTSDGRISGTPTAGGTGSITARATYKGVNGQQTYQVVSLDIAVSLSGATIPLATAGTAIPPYDLKTRLTITGDDAYPGDGTGVTWTYTGTILAGLSLGADGRITGTPTVVGATRANVTATYKNKASAPASFNMSSNANVVLNGSTRNWSDGTYASSCAGYLSPTVGHIYAGATGTGVYRISPAGTPMDVYCDMVTDGGGWTLLMKQANGDGTTLQGDTTYWINGTTLNDAAANLNTNDGNLVSAAFAALPTTQLKLQASNESTTQLHSNSSAMTAQNAFSNANLTSYSDAIYTWNPSAPNWSIHTTTYPNGNTLTAARLGFNFGEIWTWSAPGVIRCAARWGWAGNQDSSESPVGNQAGSFDACGGLGGWGVAYGSSFMNNSKNTWQPATYYLWGR